METVTLDGKTYIKAVKAADIVGYAPDYVGQLCRKGLLEAIILGKTWYVSEESLLAHKNSQTRTNTGITRRDIEKQKDVLVRAHGTGYAPSSVDIDNRKRLLDTGIRYTKDADELLPSMAEKLEVVAPGHETYTPQDEIKSQETPIPETSEELSATEESFPIEEYEDPDEPVAEYLQEDGYIANEETAVPIRKIQDSSPLVRPARRPSLQTYESPTEEYAYSQEGSIEHVPDMAQERRSRRRSYRLVPIATLLLLIFLIANLVLESTWFYATSGQKKTSFHTTYNLASLSSLLTAFKKD